MPHSTTPGYAPPLKNPLPEDVRERLDDTYKEALAVSITAYEDSYPKDSRLARWTVDGEELMYNVHSLNMAAARKALFLVVRMIGHGNGNEPDKVSNEQCETVRRFLAEVITEAQAYLEATT